MTKIKLKMNVLTESACTRKGRKVILETQTIKY